MTERGSRVATAAGRARGRRAGSPPGRARTRGPSPEPEAAAQPPEPRAPRRRCLRGGRCEVRTGGAAACATEVVWNPQRRLRRREMRSSVLTAPEAPRTDSDPGARPAVRTVPQGLGKPAGSDEWTPGLRGTAVMGGRGRQEETLIFKLNESRYPIFPEDFIYLLDRDRK